MKKVLLGAAYIILLFALVFFAQIYKFSGSLTVTSFDPEGIIEILCFLLLGAFLGLPHLIKTIKTHGRASLNVLSLALAVISFVLIVSRIINYPLVPYICDSQGLCLILLGFALAAIVKKEPAAQIS